MNIHLVTAEVFHEDGQTDECTDTIKLKDEFHNFKNTCKNGTY
jgi:hypothetical protein